MTQTINLTITIQTRRPWLYAAVMFKALYRFCLSKGARVVR